MMRAVRFSVIILTAIVTMAMPEMKMANMQESPQKDDSEIQSLTSDATDLENNVDFWTKWNIGFVAAVVVIAGGVFLTQFMLNKRNKSWSEKQAELIQAKDRQLSRVLSANEQETTRLKQLAEKEHLARVELESKVAWRRLDPKAQSEVASHLSHFAGEPALIAYNPNDVEASSFASDIAATLHAAKWDIAEPLAVLSLREGPVPFGTNPRLPTGVLVWRTDDEASREAATALIEQLSSRGFDAIISPDHRNLLGIHPTPTRVVASVEHKPEGAQGEYKLSQQSIHK
jgi:hypothetical protein